MSKHLPQLFDRFTAVSLHAVKLSELWRIGFGDCENDYKDLHQGRVFVKSEGHTTCFTLEFPLE